MTLQSIIISLAVIFNGLLAGMSIDTSLVKLPARRRIGNIAYAVFARGNDLGNGIIVYSALAISAGLFVIAATIIALLEKINNNLLLQLIIASITTVIHFIGTVKAAPVMLSIKNTPDDEAVLKGKFDKFERWHGFRACFQLVTFLILLYSFSMTV
jgi:hypothetical protein